MYVLSFLRDFIDFIKGRNSTYFYVQKVLKNWGPFAIANLALPGKRLFFISSSFFITFDFILFLMVLKHRK